MRKRREDKFDVSLSYLLFQKQGDSTLTGLDALKRRGAEQPSPLGRFGQQLVVAGARQEDQARPLQRKVAALGTTQPQMARLQQVDMAALVRVTVAGRAAQPAAVEHPSAHAELREQGGQTVHRPPTAGQKEAQA